MAAELDELVDRLERTAAELRTAELEPERAAVLVEECARLAAEAGARLEREVGAHGEDARSPGSGQLPLA